MHLNLPPEDEPERKEWVRQAKWSLMGVVAPELVVLAAWRQWTSAMTLQESVMRPSKDEDVLPPIRVVTEDSEKVNP